MCACECVYYLYAIKYHAFIHLSSFHNYLNVYRLTLSFVSHLSVH